MPDEIATPETPTASDDTERSEGVSPEQTEEAKSKEASAWLRDTALGRFYSPPKGDDAEEPTEPKAGKSQRAERTGAKDDDGQTDEAQERVQDKREFSEDEFRRAVQAETDRREATRVARERQQRERQLRRTDPQAYAQTKEQEDLQMAAAEQQAELLRGVSQQFDEATVTPLVQALTPEQRQKVLDNAGHGIDGRKEIVKRSIETLRQSAYDDGFKRGKAEAEKSLRKPTSSFRKELLSELRGSDDEPELAPASGGAGQQNGFDPNDWMRASIRRR
jgi:hypothetical protein